MRYDLISSNFEARNFIKNAVLGPNLSLSQKEGQFLSKSLY